MSLFSMGSIPQQSLISGGSLKPTEDLPFNDDIAYWWAADLECYSDTAKTTPCANNDGVACWGNLARGSPGGFDEDAIQSTPANRPRYKTGGQNGLPYLEFDVPPSTHQFFEDLTAWTIGSGTTNPGPIRAMAFVVDLPDDTFSEGRTPAFFGSTDTGQTGGKAARYVLGTSNPPLYHQHKSSTRGGGWWQDRVNAAMTSMQDANGSRCWMTLNGYRFGRFGSLSNADSSPISSIQFCRNTGLGGDNGQGLGRLYEVIAWGGGVRPDSSAEQDLVMDYLLPKYNITPETVAPSAWV